MRQVKKMFRVILIILIVAFIIIQFIRPEKITEPEIKENQITAKFVIPNDVHSILKSSCYDCHSNTTYYPWYDVIQPVDWFLYDHVVEGKRELNFSNFSNYPLYRQFKKFKEIEEQVKEGEMPLLSYTLIYPGTKLNAE